MSFINWIIDKLSDIGTWFYTLALRSWDVPLLPNAIGDLFYDLHGFFVGLAWDFVDFGEWVDNAVDELGDILSWSNIRSLIRTWLPALEDAIDWWDRWWVWVGQEIEDWWDDTLTDVKSLINIATEGLDDLLDDWNYFWRVTFPSWTARLDDLKAGWDNFWTVTFPSLVSFDWLGIWWDAKLLEVQDLLDTAFTLRVDFWDGWQDKRDEVFEFFTDPLEWLWTRFTNWFLGPEA